MKSVVIPGPNLDTENCIEFFVEFYNCTILVFSYISATFTGLSLRGEGQGFPLVTKNVAPDYFLTKIEVK